MAKDYAKQSFETRTRKRNGSKDSTLTTIIIALVFVILCLVGIYYLREQNFFSALSTKNAEHKIDSLLANLKKSHPHPNKTPLQEAQEKVDNNPPVRFDFYTELPKMKVEVKKSRVD